MLGGEPWDCRNVGYRIMKGYMLEFLPCLLNSGEEGKLIGETYAARGGAVVVAVDWDELVFEKRRYYATVDNKYTVYS